MEYLNAIILGIVQGIAEFLPVSSSGHLVIVDGLLRDFSGTTAPKESVTMEIALHFGTLLSILVVYRDSLIRLLSDRHLITMIVVATIPVGLVGVLLKPLVDSVFAQPILAGCGLLVTALFLLVGRSLQKSGHPISTLTVRSATVIGLFQAVAIVPGISRSGSTIAAGMACGLDRENAARFSFLIAIPAIGGAALVQMKDLITGEELLPGNPWPLVLGTVIAFGVGILSLRWLIRIVMADRLHLFAIYCLIAGCATICWQLART